MNHEYVMCALAKKKHHVRYIMLNILYNFFINLLYSKTEKIVHRLHSTSNNQYIIASKQIPLASVRSFQ